MSFVTLFFLLCISNGPKFAHIHAQLNGFSCLTFCFRELTWMLLWFQLTSSVMHPNLVGLLLDWETFVEMGITWCIKLFQNSCRARFGLFPVTPLGWKVKILSSMSEGKENGYSTQSHAVSAKIGRSYRKFTSIKKLTEVHIQLEKWASSWCSDNLHGSKMPVLREWDGCGLSSPEGIYYHGGCMLHLMQAKFSRLMNLGRSTWGYLPSGWIAEWYHQD